MDYEKKYKEALERARVIKSKILQSHLSTESCKAVSNYIDEIIPELTESEDERTRQSLLAYIKGESKRLDTKKWIAYLEKQKEQKPFNVCEQCPHYWDCPDSNERKSDTRTADDLQLLGFIYDLLASLDWRENYAMSKEECLRRLNDYRPQKPADLPAGFYFIDQDGNKYYSKEFRYNNGTFTTTMKVMEEQKPVEGKEYTSPDCGTSACCGDERFEIIAQAKRDIIEKTNIAENELSMELPLLDGILMRVWQVGWLNKKPAEWSEEDEHRRKDAIYFLESAKRHYADTSEIEKTIDWLKSLRPQPKIEWSEKEYGRLFDIEHYLDGTLQLSPDRKIACIDFLKSLRPSWKPSEAQMEALLNAEKYLNAGLQYGSARRIAELIKQFKKLGVKEEPEYYQHFDPDC